MSRNMFGPQAANRAGSAIRSLNERRDLLSLAGRPLYFGDGPYNVYMASESLHLVHLATGVRDPSMVYSPRYPVLVAIGVKDFFYSWNIGNCYALTASGKIYAWGSSPGYYGDGSSVISWTPKQVGTGKTWSKLAVHYNAVYAIATDGTVWRCGDTANGVMANGSTASGTMTTLTQLGTATNWTDVWVRYGSVYLRNASGQLWVAGANNNGQLGIGTTAATGTLTLVSGAYQMVCPADYSVTALGTNGWVYAWGWKAGAVDAASATSPSELAGPSSWMTVARSDFYQANYYHVHHLIKTDGTLWELGYYNSGGSSTGPTFRTTPFSAGGVTTPFQVATGQTWKQVMGIARGSVMLALTTAGRLYSNGSTGNGQQFDPLVSASGILQAHSFNKTIARMSSLDDYSLLLFVQE